MLDTKISVDDYKKGMRQLAGGVAIVSSHTDEGPVGMTATSVTSLAAEPPSLLVCINAASPVVVAIIDKGQFTVSFLRKEQEDLAKRFAGMTSVTGPQRFEHGDWCTADEPSPLLKDALVSFRCRLVDTVSSGTHLIVIGEIDTANFGNTGDPLVHSNGGFGTVAKQADIQRATDTGVPIQSDAVTGMLREKFDLQRTSFDQEGIPDYATRKKHLGLLMSLVERNRSALCDTLSQDFGNRALAETQMADINGSLTSIGHTQSHFKRWMRPERRGTSIWFLPGSGKVVRQPLGVVGVMSPWNYPIHLTLAPAAAALAAGNRVMAKMSEDTPHTTELMQRLISENFDESVFTILGGEADVSAAFSALPFDHLFFTGSTGVGRKVMEAAAKNLTPVTLELGGKSPVIIDDDYPLEEAAHRIAWGKLINCGQTCVAPDYALVPKGKERAVADAILSSAKSMFPNWQDNADLTSVINEGSMARLGEIVKDAEDAGAQVLRLDGVNRDGATGLPRRFPLTIILNPDPNSRIMREEIFGPILPIIGVENLKEATSFINNRDAPLALYLFSKSSSSRTQVLAQTRSGGVTFNDTLLHYLQEDLPFGGVGASGMGNYHGRDGFDTFSHKRAVFSQRGFGSFTGTKLLYPPYGPMARMILKLMRRIP